MTASDHGPCVPAADANEAVRAARASTQQDGRDPDWDGFSTHLFSDGSAFLSPADLAEARAGIAEGRNFLGRRPDCLDCDTREELCGRHEAEWQQAVSLTGLIQRLGGEPS